MKTFFISDTHFNHKRMVEWRHMNSVEEMNELIISNWNSVVQPDDFVYHLGDVDVGNIKDYKNNIAPRLNGNILYIKGNHDSRKNLTRNTHLIMDVSGYEIELVHNPSARTGCTDYVIHGHIHNNEDSHPEMVTETRKTHVRFFNVNLEFHDYKPVELQYILNILLKPKSI